MAEALLRARLAESGVSDVSVASVGVLFDGRVPEPGAEAAMAKRGIDISAHRSRMLDPDALAEADLLVTMEVRHLYALAEAGVDHTRAFTLPDLVARAEQIGPRAAADPIFDWLARLSLGRPATGWIVPDPSLEVEDPMGGSRRKFRQCADLLSDLVDRFVAVAWPPADALPAISLQTRSTP